MEQHSINFQYGIHRAPSITGNDGELSECVNLIPKNGELVNIKPYVSINKNSNNKLVAIHKLSDGNENYIYYYENNDTYTYKIFYNDNATGYTLRGSFVDAKITGNILVISTSQSIDYFVWKEVNGVTTYRQLGDIPEIEIGFYLSGHGFTSVSESRCITGKTKDGWLPGYYEIYQTEQNYNTIKGQAISVINKAHSVEHKFCLPFFVRYGIELYDGSIIKQSSPELMLINTGSSPIAFSNSYSANGNEYSFDIETALRTADLYAKIKSSSFEDWEGIIKGVVVAITSPLYKYNQGEEYNTLKDKNIDYNLTRTGGSTGTDYASIFNKEFSYILNNNEIKKEDWGDVDGDYPLGGIYVKYNLPCFNDEQYRQNILNASNFYIISRLTREECITSSDKKIDITNINISEIATYPTMDDDFNSHNSFSAGASFVYNNRLSIANINETLKPGVMMISPIDYQYIDRCRIFTYINEDDRKLVTSYDTSFDSLMKWAFYPHSGAYKMEVYTYKQGAYKKYEITLKPHPYLNGAYWTEEESPIVSSTVTNIPDAVDNPVLYRHNYIYTSKVDNPFLFPVDMQETIGTGTIKAVSTSAKALSEGQFGQFPLYAFCSDGIWALSVGDNGKYMSTNPVSRDVVENIKSICQIDSAVVFATAQGMKMLSGSDVQLFSQFMDGENVDEDTFFNDLDSDHTFLKSKDVNSFVNMLSGCSVMYDYANQLLRVYPENSKKTYVFSFLTNEWSTEMPTDNSQMKAIVHGYPYSTIQLSSGDLMQYTNEEDNTTVRYGVLLTRPICMDGAFSVKSITDLKLFYYKTLGQSKCKIAVFASNDCRNWHRVTSLHTGSFKWFRFRIQTALTDINGLASLMMLYDIRRTNKIR